MSLAGNLEELTFPEVLQLLASLRASGKLMLTQLDRQGLVVVRQGRIIYAVSTSVRETLGSILVARRLVSGEVLRQALEAQHDASRELRLGSVLIDMGAIDPEALRQAVTWQIEQVVSELTGWKRGFFKFEALEIPDRGEIEVDLQDFLMPEGVTTEKLLLKTAGAAHPLSAEAARTEPARTSLGRLLNEVQPPELTGELLHEIVRVGQRTVRRGVLLIAQQGELRPKAQFGLEDGNELARRSFPLRDDSFLARIAGRHDVYRGAPPDSPRPESFIASLGERPQQVLIIPIQIGRRVQALFYGDDAGLGEPLGSSEELELLVLRAQIAMEQTLLERRKAYLERELDRRQGSTPGT